MGRGQRPNGFRQRTLSRSPKHDRQIASHSLATQSNEAETSVRKLGLTIRSAKVSDARIRASALASLASVASFRGAPHCSRLLLRLDGT